MNEFTNIRDKEGVKYYVKDSKARSEAASNAREIEALHTLGAYDNIPVSTASGSSEASVDNALVGFPVLAIRVTVSSNITGIALYVVDGSGQADMEHINLDGNTLKNGDILAITNEGSWIEHGEGGSRVPLPVQKIPVIRDHKSRVYAQSDGTYSNINVNYIRDINITQAQRIPFYSNETINL